MSELTSPENLSVVLDDDLSPDFDADALGDDDGMTIESIRQDLGGDVPTNVVTSADFAGDAS